MACILQCNGPLALRQTQHLSRPRSISDRERVTVGCSEDSGVKSSASRQKDPPKVRRSQPDTQPSDWRRAAQLMKDGESIQAIVESSNRGGAIIREPNEALAEMVGETIIARIVEVSQPERSLILSERDVVIEQGLERLRVGEVVKGVVTAMRNFGAFVSIANPLGPDFPDITGLVHLSELSWDKLQHPGDIIQVGEELDLKILAINPSRLRLALSLKAMTEDPLEVTLDSILPLSNMHNNAMTEDASEDIEIPDLPLVIASLSQQEGIYRVELGRRVTEKHVVSQDLELWMSKTKVSNGFAVLARQGPVVQELEVTTDMPLDKMKEAVRQASVAASKRSN